jgi:hypothetical protein
MQIGTKAADTVDRSRTVAVAAPVAAKNDGSLDAI